MTTILSPSTKQPIASNLFASLVEDCYIRVTRQGPPNAVNTTLLSLFPTPTIGTVHISDEESIRVLMVIR